MADEQYKWLNRETAERLLRGESLEAVDASARDQAERLSKALGALSAQAAPAAGELPGEQAALAAFRKVREAADAEQAATGRALGGSRPRADAGLVRIGAPARTGIRVRRPRWARPVRLALAAAVTVGTLGGVAMAAGTGILPTPFGPQDPGPATSVSAGQTSAGSLSSASPQGTPGTSPTPGTPSGSARAHGGGASGEAAGPDDRTPRSTPPGAGDPSGGRWKDAASACRDLRDGKGLDAGRRRVLENLAGGSARVSRYCKVVLADADSAGGATGGGKGDGGGSGTGGKTKGNGKGSGGQGGDEEGNPGHGGKGGHPGNGGGGGKGRHGDGAAPVPSAFAPAHPGRTAGATLGPTPSPTPSPAYTAL